MKNPNSIVAFGTHLRKLREQKDMSQQDLADESEVNKKTIQKIENGRHNPSLDILISLAHGLSVTLDELIRFE